MTEKKTQAWLNQAQSPPDCKTFHFGRVSPPLELPYPFNWEGFEDEAFGPAGRPDASGTLGATASAVAFPPAESPPAPDTSPAPR